MSMSYLGSIAKHLTEIVETLGEGGTVINPSRLGQPSQTQLVVQADTTRIRHAIQYLEKLDAVKGDERLVRDEGQPRLLHLNEKVALIDTLFDAIAHGDEAHRDWLKQAIDDHFTGLDVRWSTVIDHDVVAEKPEGDIAWLIERRCLPPQYSTEHNPTGPGAFYSDVNRAHRFEDKISAETAMRRMSITEKERGEYFVSEHKWMDRGNEPVPPILYTRLPAEKAELYIDGEEWVHIPHLIGDTVLIDGEIEATVSEVLIYGRSALRYRCEYFHHSENKNPWIQPERLTPVDPNP
jgi:hypothetical protein